MRSAVIATIRDSREGQTIMARESDDPISAAIIATEKEIAGDAWGNEETDALDPTGDKSLEDLGEGLEGQHEAGEVEEVDGEETETEETEQGEGETEPQPLAAKPGEVKPGEQQVERGETQGRVPSGKLREANERARVAETERDTLKAAADKQRVEADARFDLLAREIAALKTAPRGEVKPAEPTKTEVDPDIFEDPKGFKEHLQRDFDNKLNGAINKIRQDAVAMSFELAHGRHGDAFPKAMEAINKLDPKKPQDFTLVAEIYNSPNPGESLMKWHKRETTRAEVGDDVVAYRERIAKEARESLAKDPEFRKQLLADMRGEAAAVGEDGRPRNVTRIPQSLARAQGSNVGTGRVDPNAGDGSDQGIADAAWR